MSKPRLLDLFCGAGGAAMGYHRAGFEVVGVDIEPQANYLFEFVQDDALVFLGQEAADPELAFDAIHASPPCQAFTAYKRNGNVGEYPDQQERQEARREGAARQTADVLRDAAHGHDQQERWTISRAPHPNEPHPIDRIEGPFQSGSEIEVVPLSRALEVEPQLRELREALREVVHAYEQLVGAALENIPEHAGRMRRAVDKARAALEDK